MCKELPVGTAPYPRRCVRLSVELWKPCRCQFYAGKSAKSMCPPIVFPLSRYRTTLPYTHATTTPRKPTKRDNGSPLLSILTCGRRKNALYQIFFSFVALPESHPLNLSPAIACTSSQTVHPYCVHYDNRLGTHVKGLCTSYTWVSTRFIIPSLASLFHPSASHRVPARNGRNRPKSRRGGGQRHKGR